MLTKIAKGKWLSPVLPKFNKSPEGNIVKKPYPWRIEPRSSSMRPPDILIQFEKLKNTGFGIYSNFTARKRPSEIITWLGKLICHPRRFSEVSEANYGKWIREYLGWVQNLIPTCESRVCRKNRRNDRQTDRPIDGRVGGQTCIHINAYWSACWIRIHPVVPRTKRY